MYVGRKREIGTTTVSLLTKAWSKVQQDKKHKINRWEKCKAVYPHVLSAGVLDESLAIPLRMADEIRPAKLLVEAGW